MVSVNGSCCIYYNGGKVIVVAIELVVVVRSGLELMGVVILFAKRLVVDRGDRDIGR